MDQVQRQRGRFAPGTSGNPAGRPKSERRDGWINSASGHGTSRDRRTLSRFGANVVTDLEAIALWRSDWLAAKIVEHLPNEAFRRGFEIKIDGKSGKKTAEELGAAVEDLGLLEAVTMAAQYARAYGGAAILPVLSGAVGDLADPLDETGILNVDALHVLEPRELHPIDWYTDVRSPKWRQPSRYRLMPLHGARASSTSWVEVHESRLLILQGVKVTSEVQPGQRQGWGDSVLSRVREVIADHGLTWGSVSTILHEFSQGVLSLEGLAEILADDENGEVLMARRLRAIDMAKSSLRSMVIDSKDSFTRATTPLSGLPETLVQLAHLVAAAADMPATILLGTSPAGLNATGESDTRAWYDRVAGIRQARYHRLVERLLRMIMLSTSGPTSGVEPDVWSVEWRPMWAPSGKEVAEERKTVAETDKLYVEMGSASPDDIARSRWGGDTYSAEMSIDWAARKRQQEADELRAAELADAELEAIGRGTAPVGATAPDEEDPTDDNAAGAD